MKTNPHLRNFCRCGFTLIEAVGAVALLGVTLTASISSFSYVTRNERLIAAQGELDMDASLLVERLRRDLWRTSRELILVYPPGDGPYQAISFPIVSGTGPILYNDNGEIEWTATVIYHMQDGSPSEVRRTVFSPRRALTDTQREQQLADVVRDGNGDNTYNSADAVTRVLIENPVEWELNISGTRFDAYAPEADRRTFQLGSAMMEVGNNLFTFTAVGKNSDNSSAYRQLAVDTLTVSRSGLPREGEWQTVSSSIGTAPQTQNMGAGEIWSGNSHLGFPATQAGNSFTLQMENDRWEERNFFTSGTIFSDISRFFIQPTDRPHTFALRLDGNSTVWVATNQTRSAVPGDVDLNALDTLALRIFVRGSDLVGSEGFDGGWIAFNGTNVWAKFARSPSAGMHIKRAFIGQSSIMQNPANNPMNIIPGTQKTFLFTNGFERDSTTLTTAAFESDKLNYLIEKTNSYVVGLLLSPNTYGNIRPAVFQNANDAVGPNCAVIINPTPAQTNETFDWSTLPSEELSDSQWNHWDTVPSNTVLNTRRILALASLRAGHSPTGTYISQIIDTQLADPSYLMFSGTATVPYSSILEMKIRAGYTNDLSDTTNWVTAVSGVVPSIHGRYAQVMANMRPGTDALSTPELQDFTLRWLGERRYESVSGIFSVGPDHGIYEVRVNGNPMIQGVTVKVSVFKEVSKGNGTAERMVSSAFAEIVPRN